MEIADLPEAVRSGNVAKIHDHTAEVVGDLPAARAVHSRLNFWPRTGHRRVESGHNFKENWPISVR
jgi:hypothetical protein